MPAQPTTRLTLACLADKTRFQIHPERSACWIWTGKVVDGRPVSYFDGQDRSARQGTWELMRGAKYVGRLQPDCGRELCVNPHHMKATA